MIVPNVLFICFALSVLIIKKRKNDTILLCVGFFAISLLVACIVIYIMKINQYYYTSSFDYLLARLIGKINISFFNIKTYACVAVTIFITAMFYIYNNHYYCSKHKRYTPIIFFHILSITYIVINSNWFAEYLHIWLYEEIFNNPQFTINIIKNFILQFSNIFIILVCILPYVRFYQDYQNTRLIFVKRGIITLCVAVLIMQTIFLFLLYSSPLVYMLNSVDLYNIDRSYNEFFNLTCYFVVIFATIIIFILTTLFLKNNMSLEVVFGKQSGRNKKSNFVMKDIRHVFHTNKNAMMIILALNNKAIKNYGTDEGLEALQNISTHIMDYTDKLCKFLDSYNTMSVNFESIQLVDCVKSAVVRLKTISDVDVDFCVECDNTMVYGDAEQLTEMFYNIVANAFDALKNKKDGLISINIWNEDKWSCVTVHDNGMGMSRRTMHNISKPFFSTKKTFSSMGIGFTYAKKVAETHGGYINFRSKQGKFSEFQVIIPKDS